MLQILRVGIRILLPGLTPPHYCACHKPEPGFPTSYVVVFFFIIFNEFRWEVTVRFADISGIVIYL
jgi:hypothetical protein